MRIILCAATISAVFNIQIWIIWLIGTYLLGAVPFGFIIGKLHGKDIRTLGSKNIGATNTGRVLGRKWGIICFVLDVLKGFAPVITFGIITGFATASGHSADSSAIHTLQWFALAVAAIVGHVFPIYLKFKGGKGVATSLGAILGIFPVLTIGSVIAALVWLVIVKTSKYVSLGSIIVACILPVLAIALSISFGKTWQQVAVYAVITIALGALVIFRHKSNIARLIAGEENKVKW